MNQEDRTGIEYAQFKLGIISPALNKTYTEPSMAAYFRRIASNPVGLPDGTTALLNPSTIASWRLAYLKEGFEGLMPKKRSDRNQSRRIDADLALDIQRLRMEKPNINATMMLAQLIEQGYITQGEISVSTMQRFFRRTPVPVPTANAQKDRRAFESARVNGIWQADTLYGPYVGTPAKRAYMQAIIDDKSRKIVAARFVDKDNAATFQETLYMAVSSHGIPEKLFVDNGGPYKNGQLSLICGGLGIVLLHAGVRDGAAKGKIERWNRTLRMRFLSDLPAGACDSIDALNAAFAKWVLAYNQHVHSSTKMAPAEAWAAESENVRWAPGGQDGLKEAFRNRITRKVANDATVVVDHIRYDVPMGYVGEKVDIRFTPGRSDDTWFCLEGSAPVRIVPTDKAANADTPRRKAVYSIDFKESGDMR